MELTPKQQTIELLKKSQKILLATHINPDGDGLGSVIALALALKKLKKDVTVAAAGDIANRYKFLTGIDLVNSNFASVKNLVITIDTSKADIEKLGYKKAEAEKKLRIIVTPKSGGSFAPTDVTVDAGSQHFDLIVVVDTPVTDRLGALYDDNTELFYSTPVINIDHHPGNDYFGKVNWIDLTATSAAEILVSLIESLARETPLLDSEIATALLTGIISDTGSFQHANTTPKSFTVAAQLVAAGARQQEIIKHLFKTKPLTTLKLWGSILSNLHEEPESRFVWSAATMQDFQKFGAEPTETGTVVDELLKTVPNIDFALLLGERQGGVYGSFRGTEQGKNVSDIAKLFGGGGHDLAAAFFLPDTTLAKAQDDVIRKIRAFQKENTAQIAATE